MRAEGALGTPGTTREAHGGGEIQDRPVPLSDPAGGRDFLHQSPEVAVRRGGTVPGEAEEAPVDPRRYAVDRGHPPPEGDRQRRMGGVGSHAGELQQSLDRAGNPTPPHHLARQLPERLSPAHQAEGADHRSDRVHPGTSERARVGPALEQRTVDAGDGLATGALQQHLGDQDPEGIGLRPPGEFPPVPLPPAQELTHEHLPIAQARHGPHDTRPTVRFVTDAVGALRHDRGMDVLVTITILDDEGEEVDTVSASADTPEEAYELALEQLDPGDGT